MKRLAALFSLTLVSGCAVLPAGPRVAVMPAAGVEFGAFRADDATCRDWAAGQAGMPVQELHDTTLARGAIAGTALGTAAGAALGSASGNGGAGALIGAASGLLLGTIFGEGQAAAYGDEAQRRYDTAYLQCMKTHGHEAQPGPLPPVVIEPPQPVVLPYVNPSHMPGNYREFLTPPLETPPDFVYSPTLGVYVAIGAPRSLFYNGSEYFYYTGGDWYRSYFYDGPWLRALPGHLPSSLLFYRYDEIERYRELEYRRHDVRRGGIRLHHPRHRR